MATTSGIAEKVEVIKEGSFGSGSGDSKEFGWIQGLTYTANTHSTAYYSTDGSNLPSGLVDGIIEYTGSLKWNITDGREFEAIFGNLTDDDAGSYSLAVQNSTPSYSFKCVLDDDQNAQIKGGKFSKIELNLAKNEIASCTGTWLAKELVELGTAVTSQDPSYDPYMFTDGTVTITGGTSIQLDNLTLTLDNATTAYRGIESSAADERRLISSMIEKNLSITGTGTAIAKQEVLEDLLGGSSLSDYRTEADLVITLTNDDNEIAFTISGLLTNFNKSTMADSEVMLVDFDFIGSTISGAGTYPNP